MLGKLLKYEVKYSMKLLLPLNLVLILLGFLASFSLNNAVSSLTGTINGSNIYVTSSQIDTISSIQRLTLYFIFLTYILAVVLVGIVTVFSLVRRFYKNFFTDEGYLTFTLPVKASTLFLTKIINTFIWFTLYSVCAVTSVIILILNQVTLDNIWKSFIVVFESFATYVNIHPFVLGLILLVSLFLSSLGYILLLYTCFSLGYTLTKRKLAMSILFYIGVNLLINWISSLLNAVVFMRESSSAFTYIFLTSFFSGFTNDNANIITMLIQIGVSLLQCCICYFISHYCITKKLNLE